MTDPTNEELKKLCEELNVKVQNCKSVMKAVSAIINQETRLLSNKINAEIKKI
jgi:peroxiredoxin family protein